MRKHCCGTCKYHRMYYESMSGKLIRIEWHCTNVDCDLCGIETEYEYSCDSWESKEGVEGNV